MKQEIRFVDYERFKPQSFSSSSCSFIFTFCDSWIGISKLISSVHLAAGNRSENRMRLTGRGLLTLVQTEQFLVGVLWNMGLGWQRRRRYKHDLYVCHAILRVSLPIENKRARIKYVIKIEDKNGRKTETSEHTRAQHLGFCLGKLGDNCLSGHGFRVKQQI